MFKKSKKDSQYFLYELKKISIKLPIGHMLPTFQARHPQYDRFLPFLAGHLDDGIVIDIGANVGDTLVSMAQENPKLEYWCIEGDQFFFNILSENYKTLNDEFPDVRVNLINKLISSSSNYIQLTSGSSTKTAASFNEKKGHPTYKLDEVLKELKERIVLLKSDVDGYDYDVLNSGLCKIKQDVPLLYFECDFKTNAQKDEYLELFLKLETLNYKNFHIFDNFGQYILSTRDLTILFELFEYIYRQHKKESTRTIYYLDIFTGQDSEAIKIQSLIKNYVKNLQ